MTLEWREYDVGTLISEGKLFIGDGYRAKNEELSDSGLPFARAGNINGGFNFKDADRFPEENLARVGNKVSQPGDVVFTSKGTVGRFAFVRPSTPRFVYSPQLCFWRSLDYKQINPRFLYYWMFAREFFVQFKGVAGQTDMADYVSLTDQRRMHITLPNPDEQHTIAYILGTLDDKIELNQRMNETLEAMARSVFKSWFVDFLPVRAKAVARTQTGDPVHAKAGGRELGMPKHIADLFPDRLEDCELGEIPVGWRVRDLTQVTAQITKGTTPTETDVSNAPALDTQINYLRVNAIAENGSILYDKLTKIPETVHKGALKRSILRANDVVYTIAGTIGRVGVVEDDLLPANTNQAVAIIRPKPGLIPPGFLVLTMRQQAFQEELHSNIVHAVQANLSLGMISRANVVFPPLDSLDKIFKPIEDLLRKASANRRESRTLAALRDTLLPKLLSGEIRATRR